MERSGARTAANARDLRIALLFAVLAMALALARPVAGGSMGFVGDSVNYVSVADSLAAGDGFRQVFENDFTIDRYTRTEAREPYVRWAPLYPVLLAVTSASPFLTTWTAALPLNVVAFGVLTFACSLWLLRSLSSRRVALWCALAITLSPPLARMAAWTLTETLFSLFLVLALMTLEARLRGGGGRRALWLGVACAALACLLRYSGLALAAFGIVALLFLPRADPLHGRRVRARDATAWLLSAAPIGLWMARNAAIGHGLTGVREDPHVSLTESLAGHLRDFGVWLFPQHASFMAGDPPGGNALVVAITCLLALFALRVLRFRRTWFSGYRNVAFAVFGGFVALYFLFLVFWAAISYLYPIGSRHIVPLYAPIVLLLGVMADSKRRGQKGVRFYLTAAVAIFWISFLHGSEIVPSLSESRNFIISAPRPRSEWEIVRYVQSHTPDVLISNVPSRMYLITDGKSRSYPLLPGNADAVAEALSDQPEGTWVVWMHDVSVLYGRFGHKDLRRNANLEVIADLPDGVVFRVRHPASISPRRRRVRRCPQFSGAAGTERRIRESDRVRLRPARRGLRASRRNVRSRPARRPIARGGRPRRG